MGRASRPGFLRGLRGHRRLGLYEEWILLSAAIGLVSGVAGLALYEVHLAAAALVSEVLGQGRLYTPLVVASFVAVSALAVSTLWPGPRGYGINAVLEAYHRRAGLLDPAHSALRSLAAAFAVGEAVAAGL